jgi:hypothetical protein
MLGGRPVTAGEIARALSGRRSGRGWIACCPAHEDRSPSLSICDAGEGNIILVKCHAGCDQHSVIAALRSLGLWVKASGGDRSPRPHEKATRIVDSYELKQRDKAGWLWAHSKPGEGSVVAHYARDVRRYEGSLPPTLRFLPPHKREHFPAMIGAFGFVDEPEPGLILPPYRVEAVHLTLLRPDGSGKADVKPNKLVVGSPRGCPIVIAPLNDLLGLAVCEGIEDALTAFGATGLGVWAAGAAGLMPALAANVPGYVEAVTIFAHDDPAGQRGAKALAERLLPRGDTVEVRIEGLVP